MSVWIIGPEDADDWFETLEYGYFTSQQAAEDFLRGVNEPLRQKYEAHAAEIEQTNRRRAARDELREQSNTLLRENGLPEMPGWTPGQLSIPTYEQWSRGQTSGLTAQELREHGA